MSRVSSVYQSKLKISPINTSSAGGLSSGRNRTGGAPYPGNDLLKFIEEDREERRKLKQRRQIMKEVRYIIRKQAANGGKAVFDGKR